VYAELVEPECPPHYAPVLATDGRVYDNPCLARMAGANVVRAVPQQAPTRLAGLGEVISGVPNAAVAIGVGVVAFLLLRKRR
jgi:hypothetical protein